MILHKLLDLENIYWWKLSESWAEVTNLNPKLIFTRLPLASSSPPSSWTNINYYQCTVQLSSDLRFYIVCVCDNIIPDGRSPSSSPPSPAPPSGGGVEGVLPSEDLEINWDCSLDRSDHTSDWSLPGHVARQAPIPALYFPRQPNAGWALSRPEIATPGPVWVARLDTVLLPGI